MYNSALVTAATAVLLAMSAVSQSDSSSGSSSCGSSSELQMFYDSGDTSCSSSGFYFTYESGMCYSEGSVYFFYEGTTYYGNAVKYIGDGDNSAVYLYKDSSCSTQVTSITQWTCSECYSTYADWQFSIGPDNITSYRIVNPFDAKKPHGGEKKVFQEGKTTRHLRVKRV